MGKIMLWMGKKFCYHITGIVCVTCLNLLKMGILMGAMKILGRTLTFECHLIWYLQSPGHVNRSRPIYGIFPRNVPLTIFFWTTCPTKFWNVRFICDEQDTISCCICDPTKSVCSTAQMAFTFWFAIKKYRYKRHFGSFYRNPTIYRRFHCQ